MTSENIDDQPDEKTWWSHLGQQKTTLISLLILFLVSLLLYVYSTWSAVQVSHAARVLAETARQVTAHGGNDDALQREMVIQLEQLQHRNDWSEAALHLAVAFIVSIVIIVTVELSSMRRTHREISEYRDLIAREAWSALSRRLVPAVIVDEVQGILKSEVVKDDVRYTITFLHYDGLPEGFIVLRRQVVYRVRNVTKRATVHLVRSLIRNSHPDVKCKTKKGDVITLPRHVELRIGGKNIPLSESTKTLKRNSHGQLRDLEYAIGFGRNEDAVEVYMVTEEQAPVNSENHYIQVVPVTSLTVKIDNMIEDVVEVREVSFAHPNYADFKESPDGTYRYDGGVLPGQ